MSYGKVHDVFWEDDKIETLSDRAALLALFLITGPHRNAIGCFRLGIGAITDIPRFGAWGGEGASEALHELVDMGFIVRDASSGWTFIVNALKHDPIRSENNAIHALSLTARVPKNTVVYQTLKEKIEPQLEPHGKGLQGKEGWPLPSPFEGASKPLTKPLRTPSPLPSPSPEPSPFPEGSVSNETGADAPSADLLAIPLSFVRPVERDGKPDWSHALFRQGLEWLSSATEKPPDKLRPLIAKWQKLAGPEKVFRLLVDCEAREVAEPVEYVTAALHDDDEFQQALKAVAE